MRIWDINPGYLNRYSLLGEHRELHAIVSITLNGKKGYAHHPETLRWTSCGWAITMRHKLLVAEMAFRGYSDRSPVDLSGEAGHWPISYVDAPGDQFNILEEKYVDKEPGRIPLPLTTQQLWSQHKYSVLARDISAYQSIGKAISVLKGKQEFSVIALQLVECLQHKPSVGGIRNALQHMWGYVSKHNPVEGQVFQSWSLMQLLEEIQKRAHTHTYVMTSTALSELRVWI